MISYVVVPFQVAYALLMPAHNLTSEEAFEFQVSLFHKHIVKVETSLSCSLCELAIMEIMIVLLDWFQIDTAFSISVICAFLYNTEYVVDYIVKLMCFSYP